MNGYTMNDRQAFLLAILDGPGHANRLEFADWLHEHGEEEAARSFREARGGVGLVGTLSRLRRLGT